MTGLLFDLGTVDYGTALTFQRDLASKRAREEIPDSLVVLEHNHVITLGRKTSPSNFKPQRVPVFQVERGGDATYHGPGQLVGYPVVLLEDHDVRRHVTTIEKALINAVSCFGVKGSIKEGHPGVWVGERKLASVGVAVTNWVTYHGFALNVNTEMSYFDLIRPCGLEPQTMTSMQAILGRRVDFDATKRAVIEEYSRAKGEEFVSSEKAELLVSDKRK
jgi:lipoate-protein ligase B